MPKTPLHVQGMHGMGDCLHERAVLRQLMPTHSITLETSWPSIFHDLVGPDLKLVRRPVGLHSQTANAIREADKFSPYTHPGLGGRQMRVMYHGAHVMKSKSRTVLEAMCMATGTSYAEADFTLPVPDAWIDDLDQFLRPHLRPVLAAAVSKPWLVHRPLVARPEWRGSMARNADPLSYAKLLQPYRDSFFVISVADLVPGREWIVGHELKADLTFHHGELYFERLAALFKLADLVYTSSGFAAILAPAVGTPVVSVVGGYEHADCHASGNRHAPFLGIDPPKPCGCWSSACRMACDKRLNMDLANDRLKAFLSYLCIQISDNTTTFDEMFSAPAAPNAGPLASPFPAPQTIPGDPRSLQYQQLLAMQRKKIWEAAR